VFLLPIGFVRHKTKEGRCHFCVRKDRIFFPYLYSSVSAILLYTVPGSLDKKRGEEDAIFVIRKDRIFFQNFYSSVSASLLYTVPGSLDKKKGVGGGGIFC
jgi:hypothetical protein